LSPGLDAPLAVRAGAACRVVVGHEMDSNRKNIKTAYKPPLAPDLNPVEAIWGHAKCSGLANFVPDDINHVREAVIESIGDLDERLKHSFFQTAHLPL
jgi:transposase